MNRSLTQKNQELAEEIELRLDAEKQLETSLEQALLISNRQGEILFATRQAQLLLDTFFSSTPRHRLPFELEMWLRGPDRHKAAESGTQKTRRNPDRSFRAFDLWKPLADADRASQRG